MMEETKKCIYCFNNKEINKFTSKTTNKCKECRNKIEKLKKLDNNELFNCINCNKEYKKSELNIAKCRCEYCEENIYNNNFKNNENNENTKKCSNCNINKNIDEFTNNYYICKFCKSLREKLRLAKKNEQNIQLKCIICQKETYVNELSKSVKCNKCDNSDLINNNLIKCTNCNIIKSVDNYKLPNHQCKDCIKLKDNERYLKKIENYENIEDKTILIKCITCKKEKILNNFRASRNECNKCENKKRSEAILIRCKNDEYYKYIYNYRIYICKIKSLPLNFNKLYFNMINCNPKQLKLWFEFQFKDTEYTFENYNILWSIEHNIPISYVYDNKDKEKYITSWYNISPIDKQLNKKKQNKINTYQLKMHMKKLIEFSELDACKFKPEVFYYELLATHLVAGNSLEPQLPPYIGNFIGEHG